MTPSTLQRQVTKGAQERPTMSIVRANGEKICTADENSDAQPSDSGL